MSFNLEKLREIAKPASRESAEKAKFRIDNADWLKKSAMMSLEIERKLRIKGMSKGELAEKLGVSAAQVTKILSGKENLGIKTIVRIEKALNTEIIKLPEHSLPYIAQIEAHYSNADFSNIPFGNAVKLHSFKTKNGISRSISTKKDLTA